jgi:hypothetical protein
MRKEEFDDLAFGSPGAFDLAWPNGINPPRDVIRSTKKGQCLQDCGLPGVVFSDEQIDVRTSIKGDVAQPSKCLKSNAGKMWHGKKRR